MRGVFACLFLPIQNTALEFQRCEGVLVNLFLLTAELFSIVWL